MREQGRQEVLTEMSWVKDKTCHTAVTRIY